MPTRRTPENKAPAAVCAAPQLSNSLYLFDRNRKSNVARIPPNGTNNAADGSGTSAAKPVARALFEALSGDDVTKM